MEVIDAARDQIRDPAVLALRGAFGLSDDEAEALVHAVDRWTEAKWAHIRTGTAPAWATVRERTEGRNLHG